MNGSRVALTGSIAVDYLMAYPGRFADHLVAGGIDQVSLSFLADTMEMRYGGVAANIAVGMAALGGTPALVGAAGIDFADYRRRLEWRGVDTASVLVSATARTATFVCTTDERHNQIATFYAGAMAEARSITLQPVADRLGGLDLVLVSPDDPAAMLRHAGECREAGYPFAVDPSQQLARLAPEHIRELIDGAGYLFTNAYERLLLLRHTGWTESAVLDRVGVWVTTHGADGVRIHRRGDPPSHVPAAPVPVVADPTGAGDAFRAGFLTGALWGWDDRQAARLGCALAAVALESVGTQEYDVRLPGLTSRFSTAYPDAPVAELARRLSVTEGSPTG